MLCFHLLTYQAFAYKFSNILHFIHQKLCRRSWYILVLPRWAVYGAQWVSFIISSFISTTLGTHIVSKFQYIIFNLKLFGFSFLHLLHNFSIWEFSCWASLILLYKSNWTLTWFNWLMTLGESVTHNSTCIFPKSLNNVVWWVIRATTDPSDFWLKASVTTLAFSVRYWIVIVLH